MSRELTIDHTRLELRHLRYFAAVADQLHFGRAAAKLALSAPSLSVQIRQLETIVGARLFDRHSRQVLLTDAGRVFAASVSRLLRDVDIVCATARDAETGKTGTLRIGFGPTLMLSNLGQAVRTYRSQQPGVQIELHELSTADQIGALMRGDLDVGFVRGANMDPRLDLEAFAREPLVIALPREHPLATARRLRISALAAEPWVLFPRAIAPLLHEQVLRLCLEAGFTPTVVQESREVYTTVGLVGAGVGVTIVPATVQKMSWEGVVYRPIPRAAVQLSMVRPSGPVRPVVDRFLAVARAEMKE